MQKMGWFGVFRGHSRSWAMPPFDRAHTTSYSTSIGSMCLSCTVFEIKPVIRRKSPILIHPTCIRRPRRGWPRSNFVEIFGTRKLVSPWAIVWCCLCDRIFSRFSRTPTCDRQTQTDTCPWLVPRMHSIARKNSKKWPAVSISWDYL